MSKIFIWGDCNSAPLKTISFVN